MPPQNQDRAFVRRFESGDVLDALLPVSGSRLSAADVLKLMRQGLSQHRSASEVIPTLFEGEPRFPDPAIARRLYQNLLGLWDLLESGQFVALDAPEQVAPPRPKATTPGPFPPDGPDRQFVENAWRHLEELDKRGRDRLQHSFENRQDSLLVFLEEQGLSDTGFDCARQLVFELFVMIELGWPPGTRPVLRFELERGGQNAREAPAALLEYANEAIFEAEQDEESPLAPEEGEKIRAAGTASLRALWAARRTK